MVLGCFWVDVGVVGVGGGVEVGGGSVWVEDDVFFGEFGGDVDLSGDFFGECGSSGGHEGVVWVGSGGGGIGGGVRVAWDSTP